MSPVISGVFVFIRTRALRYLRVRDEMIPAPPYPPHNKEFYALGVGTPRARAAH